MTSETPDLGNTTIKDLLQNFLSGSARQKLRLTDQIESISKELTDLGPELFDDFDQDSDNWSYGWILQVLNRHQNDFLSELINVESPKWFSSPSSNGIDYTDLQKCLLKENYEEADRITSTILRVLAGDNAVARGYVYFSEVDGINGVDLVTLDRLWIVYSQGKFGFSTQARILDSLGGRYEKLWPRIGWKTDGVWTRYPSSFTWSLDAPDGHMPLVNQLRGVRLMDAYLNHLSLQPRLKRKKV